MNGCQCDEQTQVLTCVEGRWFLRCNACGGLSCGVAVQRRVGARVVDPAKLAARLRDADDAILAEEQRGEDVVPVLIILAIAVIVIWAWVNP
jgi:hypothetical protein